MKPPTSGAPTKTNFAVIGGLVVVLSLGFISLRHLTDQHQTAEVQPPLPPRQAKAPEPAVRLYRPGGPQERMFYADPQVLDNAEQFRLLAESNPQAAAALVSKMPDSAKRDERMFELMVSWVERDSYQAADWVTSLPYSDMKDHATAELGLAWGKSDPTAAAAWVEENIFTENAPAGASSLVSSWSRSDLEAAGEWVDSLDPDAPARADALTALAYHLGELDPQRGLTWFSRLAEEDRNLIAVNFVASWATIDPQAAADWLRFQAVDINPRTRDQATLAAIHSWAADEAKAANASTWIDALPDSPLKENAKATFAESHAETSPVEALPWALSLVDEERRHEVAMVVLEEWVIQDRESFKLGMSENWETYEEPLRHEIYDLLLDHDPDFKDEVYRLLESDRGTGDQSG